MQSDWIQASLDGDVEAAQRIQYRVALEARVDADEETLTTETVEDMLPYVRVPAPACPGFERLDKIMSIDRNPELTKTLASYKPIWSSAWAAAMDTINEESNDEA